MSTKTKTFEEFKEKIENILDGELRGNWEFKCSETEPCYCDGFCREFIKLKNQIIEAAELYASEKIRRAIELARDGAIFKNEDEWTPDEIMQKLSEQPKDLNEEK